MEANIILGRCPTAHQLYGMRVEKRGYDWVRTWAFKINEQSAVREGYDKTNISGSLAAVDEYPGCPYCKSFNFIQCGRCGRMTCANESNLVNFRCEWCGNGGPVTQAETFKANGGQF